MTAWTAEETDRLKVLWRQYGGSFRRIGMVMGRSKGSIDGKSRLMGLQFHGGRALVLSPTHDASKFGATVFPHRVILPDQHVLKSGTNQRKLGSVVKKGAWKGFPIFSLTLEERATCPRTCAVWDCCYGNNMGHAKRYVNGPLLEAEIWTELGLLQRKHPRGFVVRLHILGDFYSVAYVDMWADALEAFPALHVFGYTARNWTRSRTPDVIGERVAALRDFAWNRFAVRTSGAHTGPRTTVVDGMHDVGKAIICPAQTGRTTNCATCGLCWAPAAKRKVIAFLKH